MCHTYVLVLHLCASGQRADTSAHTMQVSCKAYARVYHTLQGHRHCAMHSADTNCIFKRTCHVYHTHVQALHKYVRDHCAYAWTGTCQAPVSQSPQCACVHLRHMHVCITHCQAHRHCELYSADTHACSSARVTCV